MQPRAAWLTLLLFLLRPPFLAGQPEPLPWRNVPGGRAAPVTLPTAGRTGFTEMPPALCGIGFTNLLAADRYLTNQILLNGSGVAAGDVDGDGWCDLYFCGLDGPNALYRNLSGWRFEEVTPAAGVACADQASTGAALADLDGDGDLDLLVNGLGRGTRLFVNDGRGRFTERTATAGLRGGTGAHSLALADIDGDSDLDLYVVNYRTTTFRDEPTKRYRVATANQRFELLAVDGRPVTEPDLVGRFSVDRVQGVLENGEPDVLYLNDGHGQFTPVPWTDGRFLDEDVRPMSVPHDWGLSAQFHDLDADGDPDLYVCNDFQSPDRLWLNDGRGGFRALPRLAVRQTSIFSMGVDAADVDRDGHVDLFVADMFSREHARRQVQLMERRPDGAAADGVESRPQYSRNTLLWNRGDTTFAEIAQFGGVEASDWTWSPVFLDVDLDGFEDLLTVNGHIRDAQNIDIARQIDARIRQQKPSWAEELRLRRLFQPLLTPNFAFRNRGDLTFEETGAAWGFNSRKVSQGLALADLDNDGDLDGVVNCLNEAPLLCRNDTCAPRIAVRLRGAGANTRGIGAVVGVRQPGLPPQSQEILSGGRYLSCDDALRVFAAAAPDRPVELSVRWRSGARTVIPDALPNQLYELDEPPASPRTPAVPKAGTAAAPTRFEDVSARLGHVHHDEPFNDFERQPLLPHQLSGLGPGLAWFDLDGDGHEDLVVGSGRGGRPGVFRSDGRGGFTAVHTPAFDAPVTRDQNAVLGWHPRPGQTGLLAGSANYEDGGTNGPVVRLYDPAAGTVDDGLPGQPGSTGPLALADVDGDGDLDLFVGGRVIAGRCPEPASSLIFRNDGGRFQLDAGASRPFTKVGLVSGASFSDLDADGWPDLVLACQWGPVRLFRNHRGNLTPWDPPLAWATNGTALASPPPAGLRPSMLSELTGWWNSVTTGDFDGDGRPDLVAGNWGRNTKYQSHLAAPLHTYHADLNEDGWTELIEAYDDPRLGKRVPLRDWGTLARSVPALLRRYDSYTAFSAASVTELLGETLPAVNDLPVVTLDSVLLLNRTNHFEVRPLPREAQFSPVFGLAVADLDGDGCEDVFATQNCFGVAPLTSRYDAGLGVWLKGDGRGGFTAVPAHESGLRVPGEGRGVAAGDFDEDGRVDLAVGQHRGATLLFRNRAAAPGLRVRLAGPPENPTAVGAVVRVVYGDGTSGPAREWQAGGGHGSQDAATAVLGLAGPPVRVWVRWPGGTETTAPVASGATSIAPPWN